VEWKACGCVGWVLQSSHSEREELGPQWDNQDYSAFLLLVQGGWVYGLGLKSSHSEREELDPRWNNQDYGAIYCWVLGGNQDYGTVFISGCLVR
jgi:hypothetical protein